MKWRCRQKPRYCNSLTIAINCGTTSSAKSSTQRVLTTPLPDSTPELWPPRSAGAMKRKGEPTVRITRSPGLAEEQNELSLFRFSRHSFPRLNVSALIRHQRGSAGEILRPARSARSHAPIGPSDRPHTPRCNLFSRDEVLVKSVKADWAAPRPPRHPCRLVRSLVAVTPPNPRCVDCLGFFFHVTQPLVASLCSDQDIAACEFVLYMFYSPMTKGEILRYASPARSSEA
jgi:hypothetical protein